APDALHPFPTRRSSDLRRDGHRQRGGLADNPPGHHQSGHRHGPGPAGPAGGGAARRSTRVRDALMYLKRSITVNWGNLPVQELDDGPVNLFSGGYGSGKTTAADALQTLMTAAHDNLFNYNPGQDETTQRGRGGKQVRTLASYVLGCDDGAYAARMTPMAISPGCSIRPGA